MIKYTEQELGTRDEREQRRRHLAEVRGMQAFLWYVCAYYGTGTWR